jgi:hypothetical protein
MGFSSKTSYVRKTPNGISFAFNSSGALICGILLNFQKTQVQVATSYDDDCGPSSKPLIHKSNSQRVTRSKTSKQNNQTNGQSDQNQIVGGGGIGEDDEEDGDLQQPQHLKLQQNQQQQSEQQMEVIQQQHKQRQDMQDLFKEMTRLKAEMLQWPDFEPLQQQQLLEELKLIQLHVNKM